VTAAAHYITGTSHQRTSFLVQRKEKDMTKIEPEIDPAVGVPRSAQGFNRASRYIALAIALVVLLALISGIFPGVLTVPGPSPLTPPSAPLTP
jgi:hypothetical protein